MSPPTQPNQLDLGIQGHPVYIYMYSYFFIKFNSCLILLYILITTKYYQSIAP